MLEDIVTVKEMIREIDARSRTLRDRLDAIGAPVYRPFEASQAPLFPAENSEKPANSGGSS